MTAQPQPSTLPHTEPPQEPLQEPPPAPDFSESVAGEEDPGAVLDEPLAPEPKPKRANA